jgi:hypothetical protein
MNRLRQAEEQLFDAYLAATQTDVMAFAARDDDYASSMLGNKLRETNYEFRERLRASTNETLRDIYRFLVRIISEPDRFALKRKGVALPTIEPFTAREQHPANRARGERVS